MKDDDDPHNTLCIIHHRRQTRFQYALLREIKVEFLAHVGPELRTPFDQLLQIAHVGKMGVRFPCNFRLFEPEHLLNRRVDQHNRPFGVDEQQTARHRLDDTLQPLLAFADRVQLAL